MHKLGRIITIGIFLVACLVGAVLMILNLIGGGTVRDATMPY